MYQRILVPYDGSPTSTLGLDEAVKLARLTGAKLRLIHVVDDLAFATGFEAAAVYVGDVLPMMRAAGAEILAQGKQRAAGSGVEVDTVLLEGLAARVCDVVVEQVKAWGAELIVIGTHGRRGMGRVMMGSDAEQIVRMAPVPVLLVRAPGAAERVPAAGTAAAKVVEPQAVTPN
jgi:nucleotide-binding universal stress UspA family protein